MKGVLHSIQSMGTLDGPGLRTVVFLQGCSLRCKFCHSIDTTLTDRGEDVTVEELYEQVMKYKDYWGGSKSDGIRGGVTISGGDPLGQPLFLQELVKKFHEANVHVTVETSLYAGERAVEALVPYIDLWMVSLKHMDDEQHMQLTGKSSRVIHENLRTLDDAITNQNLGSGIRIRFVVIPGMTDDESHIKTLGGFVSRIKNLELLELLPYVSIGKYKWVELFGKYDLENTAEATTSDLEKVKAALQSYQLNIKI
ncbi:MAG: radical SAM protein [Candidatus Dojkabacteria bacterium]|nr:MAG: radical SAM protein [Candidatus Dojkabacteria bacterium]